MPTPFRALLPPPSTSVLAQGEEARQRAQQFFDNLGQWLSGAGDFIVGNLGTIIFWMFIIGMCGGWTALGHGLRWVGGRLPGGKRKALERAERKRLEQQRKEELDIAHAKGCACGERCDGRKKCDQHHPDCNCDHMRSFCVCQDEYECDCECRCDCKDCEGYYKEEPLLRIPHSGTPGKDRAAQSPAGVPAGDERAAPVSDNVAGNGQQPVIAWSECRARFVVVCEEWVAYECDPHELLRLPALADVTFGPTAAFIEAWYEANQLLTDTEPTQQGAAAKFIDAAERACNAWRQAVSAAERVADTRLNEGERTLLRRAKHSLNLAENAEHAGEQEQAYATAARHMRELASRTAQSRRWRLPDAARLEIEQWARPELTAGESVVDNR